MKESTIRVLKVAPGEHPIVCTLKNDLKSLQVAVSEGADHVGLIEIIGLNSHINLVCNESAKLIGLPPNRSLGVDVICGTFYITGQDDEGELASLTDEEIQTYMQRFWLPELFFFRDPDTFFWGGFVEEDEK